MELPVPTSSSDAIPLDSSTAGPAQLPWGLQQSEEAGWALKKHKVPLYVIGRQSLFGYPFAHHRYVDPVTKDVYHPLMHRGPETADVEIYQWDGLYDRWDEQPSGFAPWELARLTKDSGGIYFLLPSEEFMRVRQARASLLHRPAQGIHA